MKMTSFILRNENKNFCFSQIYIYGERSICINTQFRDCVSFFSDKSFVCSEFIIILRVLKLRWAHRVLCTKCGKNNPQNHRITNETFTLCTLFVSQFIKKKLKIDLILQYNCYELHSIDQIHQLRVKPHTKTWILCKSKRKIVIF